MQPILEWYKELPDKLGKIIDANHKGNTKRAPGHDVQTRPQLGKESAVEKEYLKSEGMDEEQIDNYVGPEVSSVRGRGQVLAAVSALHWLAAEK